MAAYKETLIHHFSKLGMLRSGLGFIFYYRWNKKKLIHDKCEQGSPHPTATLFNHPSQRTSCFSHKRLELFKTLMYWCNTLVDIKHLSLTEWSQRIKGRDRSKLCGSGSSCDLKGWGDEGMRWGKSFVLFCFAFTKLWMNAKLDTRL